MFNAFKRLSLAWCLQITKDAFQQLLGKEPKVAAIHAGLECGIIGEKVPGMDAVSYGPTITGAHSPDEQVREATGTYSRTINVKSDTSHNHGDGACCTCGFC